MNLPANRLDEAKVVLHTQRADIDSVAARVKALVKHSAFEQPSALDADAIGEIRANVMLAYRHLEDARMRLGKVIQAAEGGRSKYDGA